MLNYNAANTTLCHLLRRDVTTKTEVLSTYICLLQINSNVFQEFQKEIIICVFQKMILLSVYCTKMEIFGLLLQY